MAVVVNPGLDRSEWLTVGLNIPLLFYNTWRYFHSPTDTKELLYDPASVMNDDTLKFCQKEAWCKMSFFVLSFFYYLYWLVFPPSRARITTEIRVRVPYGSLCLSQASLGIKAGYTLDRVPHTTDNLEMPINLPYMTLDWGRKPEYPEETPEARGEHANSTHTAEAGNEPPTLEV
ncbi:hypothetical protein QTP86_011358 [Hemibagrus guttatus]|nr:hypothetical protein QTP86_011358 [Hemibagrus guttatus]